MRILTTLSVLATFLYAPAAHADDDPFAAAKTGKIECFSPDTEKKTCLDMSRYIFEGDGTVTMEDELAISANPLVSVKSKSVAKVQGSSACTTFAEGNIKNHTVFKDGKPMGAEEALPHQQKMAENQTRLKGKTICMDISPYGSVFIAQFSIDGTPLPAATNRMKWISADEGYVLAP